MENSIIKKFGLLIIFGLVGAIAIFSLYEQVAPTASVDLKYTRGEIMDQASEYLSNLGHDVSSYQLDAWFNLNGQVHLYLQTINGIAYANNVIRADTITTHHWYLNWYDRNVPPSQSTESFQAWVSPGGRVLGFQHIIKDSAARLSIPREEARALAEKFLTRQGINLASHNLKSSSETQQSNRLDHRFVWSTRDTVLEGTIWVQVLGNEVGGYRMSHATSGAFQREFSDIGTTATFLSTSSFAVFFLLFFFIVILFLKKYHEGEVGTRTAVLVFIGLFAASLLSTINIYPVIGAGVGMGDLNRFNTRIIMFGFTVFIYHVFASVMVFAAWSVGESSSRSVWPAKLTGADSIIFGKLSTLDVAEGVLRGFLWGLIILGGYAAALAWYLPTFKSGIFVQGTSGTPEALVPFVRPALAGITGAIITEIVFRIFFISYLKEKFKRPWVGVIISTILFCFTTFVVWELPFGFLRFTESYIILALFGFLFSYLFMKYDLLTTLTANFVIIGFNEAIPLFTSTGEGFVATRWLALLLLVAPMFIAAAGFVKRKRFEFTPATMPTHIQRISERERMAKELEIARRVQMSLLPKTNPTADGYDISGICIPALEVGGDYYDFVNLGGRQIGIAIGDVSGKGVPAAIYMTLTKGILQSHAEDNVSPKVVLSKVNSLMYRTIDRNSFVSMFYAILDPAKKIIRFARAGQCPVIITQGGGKQDMLLTPKGMALGLEMGKVFDAVLEEQEVQLHSGEVLVFYTDGFTEAMTETGDEFGEQRLTESLARNRHKSASEIIKGICDDVEKFTDGHPQHDDMTMVVVKVGTNSD
ncbi:MAG: PP2C family protein-serine/threonine phosphatase [Bacteroidota bacterium]